MGWSMRRPTHTSLVEAFQTNLNFLAQTFPFLAALPTLLFLESSLHTSTNTIDVAIWHIYFLKKNNDPA